MCVSVCVCWPLWSFTFVRSLSLFFVDFKLFRLGIYTERDMHGAHAKQHPHYFSVCLYLSRFISHSFTPYLEARALFSFIRAVPSFYLCWFVSHVRFARISMCWLRVLFFACPHLNVLAHKHTSIICEHIYVQT